MDSGLAHMGVLSRSCAIIHCLQCHRQSSGSLHTLLRQLRCEGVALQGLHYFRVFTCLSAFNFPQMRFTNICRRQQNEWGAPQKGNGLASMGAQGL